MHLSSSARRIARLTAAVFGTVTLVAACSMPTHSDDKAAAPDPFNPAATQLLDDTSWVLASWKMSDGTIRTLPQSPDKPVTLTLSTSTGQRHASGFSGCNRYLGSYMLQDGKLSFGMLAGTRMACQGAGGEIENAYLDALKHIDRTGVQMKAPQQLQLILEDGDTLIYSRADASAADDATGTTAK